MAGLVLKLTPNERLLINGAVLENGEQRSKIRIMTPNARILRLKDAIHPEEATTPVTRLCYHIQLILSGDREGAVAKKEILDGIETLSRIFTDPDSKGYLDSASSAMIDQNPYRALKALRSLVPRELRLLQASAD
ncbi:flagellar biosynthesis repressor FlbT [Aestuariibius insulae]|uniref:flagellar biosynthesis repressor FlbT n=1 Tax=Aestuariibius insulae TaxID=2058287 RepID=UPI00345E4CCE